MRQFNKLAVLQAVPVVLILLLVSLFPVGCTSSSSRPGASGAVIEEKALVKENINRWQDKLTIEKITVFPSQSMLARVYAKIENKSDQEFEGVGILAQDANDKRVGYHIVGNLKPGEVKTFELQTAVNITLADDIRLSVNGVKIKDKR